ncbi:MAG TPA: hypothetical protein VGL71_10825 [Urbifossiella sp.]
MSVSYTCPNAECGVTLKTPNAVPAGKRVKCPKCTQMFAPVPVEAPVAIVDEEAPKPAGTFKFADDDDKKKPPASKKATSKPATPPPPPPMDPTKKPIEEEEDDASIKRGYGVIQESQEEIEKAEEAKVNFGNVEDKYKKSARGPAIAMLVMPSNLLIIEGFITAILGLGMLLYGLWPLAFNDAPAGDEETEEAIVTMLLGCLTFGWGGLICFGASKMQELGSYMWAMMGAVMGVLPFFVGIFALMVLQNPKVKEGFEESDAGVEEEDEEEKKDDEDDEDDDEEDEDDDEPKKKRKGKR